MPRPDLGRRNLVARLSPEEMRPIDELAARLPPLRRGVPNRSEALRRIVAEWAAGQGRTDRQLVAAAKSAVTLALPHTNAKAARIAALQQAIATGQPQDVEAFGTHYRFTPDGDVIKVVGGVEEPAPERVVEGMLRDLASDLRMKVWAAVRLSRSRAR